MLTTFQTKLKLQLRMVCEYIKLIINIKIFQISLLYIHQYLK